MKGRKDEDKKVSAYIAGFKWALERDYGYIFEMDADFSHDPNDLPYFISIWKA